MRIAHVTNLFVPFSTGGAEVHCNELAKRQREAGHTVVIITNELGAVFEDPNVRNLEVRPNPLLLPLLIPQRSIDRKLAQTLRAFEPDVVHLHNVHRTLGFGAYRVAAGWPSVAMMQDYHLFCLITDNSRRAGFVCNDRSGCAGCARTFYPAKAKEAFPARARVIERLASVAGWAFPAIPPVRNTMRERFFNAWIDAVIAPSDAVRKTLLLWGVPADRVVTIGNVIRLSNPEVAADPPGTSEIRFGFIGKLAENKGLRVLLDAVRKIAQSGRHVHLRIAGDGPHAQSLRAAADGIEGVEFLGRISQERLDEFYRGVDVVVVPSTWPDPAPLVVLESMARARALIVAEIGGMPDQVGSTAITVPSNDASALGDAMTRLIDNPALAGELGARARARFFADLAPEKVLSRTEDVYRRAIAAHADKRSSGTAKAPSR
jgi:glycosyltransferase involved in cell wall biosynthesis